MGFFTVIWNRSPSLGHLQAKKVSSCPWGGWVGQGKEEGSHDQRCEPRWLGGTLQFAKKGPLRRSGWAHLLLITFGINPKEGRFLGSCVR